MDHSTQPPIFIGHLKRIQNDAINSPSSSSSSTSPYCNEIFFSSPLYITGYHIVPNKFQLDIDLSVSSSSVSSSSPSPSKKINITGRTTPDIQQRPFTLQLYGRNISTSPLKLLNSSVINGGIQFLPLEATENKGENEKPIEKPSEKPREAYNYLLFDGDFDEITIILYGEEVKSEALSTQASGEEAESVTESESAEERLVRLAKAHYPAYLDLFSPLSSTSTTTSAESSVTPSASTDRPGSEPSMFVPASSLLSSLDATSSEKIFTIFYNDFLSSFQSDEANEKNSKVRLEK